MKRISFAIVTTAGLAGCAALQMPAGSSFETDYAKVQLIDHVARDRGVTVVWINMPQRVVKAAGS